MYLIKWSCGYYHAEFKKKDRVVFCTSPIINRGSGGFNSFDALEYAKRTYVVISYNPEHFLSLELIK
jgi:hypothetical protein